MTWDVDDQRDGRKLERMRDRSGCGLLLERIGDPGQPVDRSKECNIPGIYSQTKDVSLPSFVLQLYWIALDFIRHVYNPNPPINLLNHD